jgi:hypothetical protein
MKLEEAQAEQRRRKRPYVKVYKLVAKCERRGKWESPRWDGHWERVLGMETGAAASTSTSTSPLQSIILMYSQIFPNITVKIGGQTLLRRWGGQ